MKTSLRILWLGILTMMSAAAQAGPVGALTTFTAGTTAKASEVNGNFGVVSTAVNDNDSRITTLQSTVASLQTALTSAQNQIAALQVLLAGVSRETVNGQPTVRFSGVNVQVVSGAGATDAAPNGRGNVIIGYDEARTAGPLQCSVGAHRSTEEPVPDGDAAACAAAGGILAISHKSGSHYLVVGNLHNYSQFGGMVVGLENASTNQYASVSGGVFNAAKGNVATVGGGAQNTASGDAATVSGGQNNTASGGSTSVSGGIGNTANQSFASVSGGHDNTASGLVASVSGGNFNIASGHSASVSGGSGNTASGNDSSVSGGIGNIAGIGTGASVSGGQDNVANGFASSVSGGSGNVASATGTSVSGGQGCDFGGISNKWVVGLQASAGCSGNQN